MAVIRDMIPSFELLQPTSVEEALDQLDQHREDAWVMAGGMDTFDWLKDRIERPEVVVDLGGISDLTRIRTTDDGIEIGSMVTLTEVSRNADVQERFPALAQAAGRVASPQIRNQGTIGGNVSQDVRCWYYRSGWPCYRAGGNICYADTPTAMNREHAIMGQDRCVAVNPSDTAPALVVLGAQFVVRRRGSERVIDAEDFWVGPGVDITRITAMRPNDLLVAIRIPNDMAGTRQYFEKVADRKVWDFPLVNVASAARVEGGTIQEIRLAVNGVSPVPVRLSEVEQALVGNEVNERSEDLGGRLAIRGARALRHNQYKIPMMRNLVKRAIRGEQA
ncbi:MAG: FAD binding domain-containing protein [Longimicrobiales bacterium]